MFRTRMKKLDDILLLGWVSYAAGVATGVGGAYLVPRWVPLTEHQATWLWWSVPMVGIWTGMLFVGVTMLVVNCCVRFRR